MKRLSKIIYIILILIIVCMGVAIYNVVKGDDGDDIKTKAISQIKNTESRLTNLLNTLNNVQYENYKISISNIKQKDVSSNGGKNTESSSDQKDKSGSSGGDTSDSGGDSSSSGSSGQSSGSSNSSSESSSSSEQDSKKYALEQAGILTNEDSINWDNIKSELELMYTSIPTMTLDLYQTNINQEDILKFNQEYDFLSQAAKEEDKEKTLEELAKVYEYIPKFIENCTEDASETVIAKTKSSIFNAYSVLDQDDWNSVSGSIKSATQEFSKLLTTGDSSHKNQYNVNKTYIMLNELQNAVNLEDKEIFLIKYKNILEELKSL